MLMSTAVPRFRCVGTTHTGPGGDSWDDNQGCGEERLTADGCLECLWQELLSDPGHSWDSRRKNNFYNDSPHCRKKKPKDALWLDNQRKPAGLDLQLAMREDKMKRPFRRAFGMLMHISDLDDGGNCRKVCEDGELTEAVDALKTLVLQGRHIPNNLFYQALRKCIAHEDLVLGRRVHALIVKSGYDKNSFLATHLISLYATLGRLEEAARVFAKVPTPDAYNWAAIIISFARHGKPKEAIDLYWQMRKSGFQPDNHIFVAVLKACACAGDLATGKAVHAHVGEVRESRGKPPGMFVQNSLVDMYTKCGSLEEARRVFDKILHKDVVTWNAMIAGYARQGMGQEALSLYSSMQKESKTPADSFTFACLLQACAGIAALHQGQQLHAQIEELGLQDGVVVGGSLVNMYAKCGKLENARRVFDRLAHKNAVTWNAMITGYVQQGQYQEALHFYDAMQQEGMVSPDCITFVCLLQACASLGADALRHGKKLHARAEERGLQDHVDVGSSLVNMYAKCGSLGTARKVFAKLSQKNVVTWTAMIAGYAQQGIGQEALELYTNMQHQGIDIPDSVTFVCLLQACATVAALPLGYSCQGDSERVFELLDRMKLDGVQPDGITFLDVLAVCSRVGLVDKGRHYFQVMGSEYGLAPGPEHYTCMVDLLSRAGHLEEALRMARAMPCRPNAAVWLAVLGACRKWANVEVGRQAFEFAVSLNEKDASSYVMMASIYADAQMWEEAKELKARRTKCGAWKQPGQSWTDTGGTVHRFLVGEQEVVPGSRLQGCF